MCSLQHPFLLGPLTKREAQELLDTVSNGQPAQYVDPADIEEEVTSPTSVSLLLRLRRCCFFNVYLMGAYGEVMFTKSL